MKHSEQGDEENKHASGLFYEAIELSLKKGGKQPMEKYPKYAVWENVPGAFSSNKRRTSNAFVLEALIWLHDDTVSIP